MPEIKSSFHHSVMNKDLHEKIIPEGEYRDAVNIQVSKSEGQEAGVLENVLGNFAVSSYDDATAVCIGAKKDGAQDKIYYFVKGSNEDALIEYSEITGDTRYILRDDKGILNFSVEHLITGIDLIGNGDERLLLWTDNFNPPRKINIERMFGITGGLLGGFTEEEITVVKRPPLTPPVATKTDDADLSDEEKEELERAENLKEKFPRFAYRWKYEDNEFSVFSPFTEAIFTPRDFKADRTTGEMVCMENTIKSIDIKFNTGPREVTDVELLYKEAGSNTVYVVESFNKEKEGWANNTVLGEITEEEFDITDNNREDTEWVLSGRAKSIESITYFDDSDSSYKAISVTYTLGDDQETITLSAAISGLASGDTLRIRYNNAAEPVRFSNNKLYRALPPDQLTRVFDNVPVRAKTQTIVDNRVVYGNYVDKYDIDATLETLALRDSWESTRTYSTGERVKTVNPDTDRENYWIAVQGSLNENPNDDNETYWRKESANQYVAATKKEQIVVDLDVDYISEDIEGDSPAPSLKSDRSYEIGIVYMDNVGRQTPVLTSANNSVEITQNNATKENKLTVKINSRAPDFATNYRFFIKEVRDVHYNILPFESRISDSGDVWFRIAPADLDKLNVGDYLSVKSRDGEPSESKILARVEEVGQRDANFLEVEPYEREIEFDPTANDGDGNYDEHITSPFKILQRAGVWMRLQVDSSVNIVADFSGQDDVYTVSTQVAQNNAYGDDRGKPINETNFENYIERVVHYPSLNFDEDEDPGGPDENGDQQDITFTGSYVRPNIHIGPTRFEVEITSEGKYKWFYYQAKSDYTVQRVAGDLGDELDITPGVAKSLMFQDTSSDAVVDSGIDLTFASSIDAEDWVVGDRFTCIARHSGNFSWGYIDWQTSKSGRNNTNPNTRAHWQYSGRKCNAVVPLDEVDTIREGAIIQMGIDDEAGSRRGSGVRDNPIRMLSERNRWVASKPYANLEEMFFEEGMYRTNANKPGGGGRGINIEGNQGGNDIQNLVDLGISRFGFWRGDSMFRKITHTSGLGKTRKRYQIRPQASDNLDQPLHLIVSSGVFGSAPNPDDPDFQMKVDFSFTQGYGDVFNEPAQIKTILETIPNESNLDIYYEIGDTFKCVNGIHYGYEGQGYQSIENPIGEDEEGEETLDVTSIDVTLDYFNCFAYSNGVEVQAIKDSVVKPFLDKGAKASVVYDEYEESTNYYSLIFSGKYNDATNYNALNQFSSQLAGLGQIIKQMDGTNGTIQHLYPENTNLYVLQEDKVSKVLVNKNVLFNADNAGNVTASNEFLGQTVPIVGEYGISKNPESFTVYGPWKFWADKDRGVVLQMIGDSITEISAFGMVDYFRDNLATSKVIIGGFDDYHNQFILSLKDEFEDPTVTRYNLPLLLSRQSFLSATSACRAVDSKLQFGRVYEFYTADEPLGFQIGDVIYTDDERTNIIKGADDWFVYRDSESIPLVMIDIGQDPDDTDLYSPIFRVGYPEWSDASTYSAGDRVTLTAGSSVTHWISLQDSNFDNRPTFDSDEWRNIFELDVYARNGIVDDQEIKIEGPSATTYTVEVLPDSTEALDDNSDSVTRFAIKTDHGITGSDLAVNNVFEGDIQFDYVINIDNFGIVRSKRNCASILPPNLDAFRMSLRGFHSKEEACARGVVARVMYHNGDDASPDVGDSIYEGPYDSDERDSDGNYIKGRTTRHGWFQMFDGVDLEDYVIEIVNGKVVNKERCSVVALGRKGILLGDRVVRQTDESDSKLITRICANLPNEERFYEGENLVAPQVGDRVFNDNYTSNTPASGYYSIPNGDYIRLNAQGFVIESGVCAFEECFDDVIGLEPDEVAGDRDIFDAQLKKSDSSGNGVFTFKGIYDENIFGNDEPQPASNVTILWSAKGTERYPVNPDSFYEMTINNITPDTEITLTDKDGRWDFDDTGEDEVEYVIRRFCHYKTVVPQFIGVEYYNDDYAPYSSKINVAYAVGHTGPMSVGDADEFEAGDEIIIGGKGGDEYEISSVDNVGNTITLTTALVTATEVDEEIGAEIDNYPDKDVEEFVARIFDNNGSLISDPIEVQDAIYYDTSAAVIQYYTDSSLTQVLDGTNGITDDDELDTVTVPGKKGLWWAFGDTDNSAAQEGKLIDKDGYVLAVRDADYAFAHTIYYGSTRDAACNENADDALQVFANNPDFYDDADDATYVTDMITSEGASPQAGYYKGWSYDAEGNQDANWVRYWDGDKFDEDVFATDNCPIALVNSGDLKYSTAEQTIVCGYGSTDTYYWEGNSTFGTGVTAIYSDKFGPKSIPSSKVSAGYFANGSNYYTWDGDDTVTSNVTDCSAVAYCSDSAACNYNANPGEFDFVDNSTCTYSQGVCRDSNAQNYDSDTNCKHKDDSQCTYTYNCNSATGVCSAAVGASGTYSTLAACQAVCTPPCSASYDEDSISDYTHTGSTQTVTIIHGELCTASTWQCVRDDSDDTWITIGSINNVEGNEDTVPITTAAYTSETTDRTGQVNCTYNGYTAEIPIKQLKKPVSYNCQGYQNCVKIDGSSGTYTTLSACQASDCYVNQSWNCVSDVCTAVSGSGGDYSTLAECEADCGAASMWACDGEGGCTEDADGTYSSQEACETECGVGWNCDGSPDYGCTKVTDGTGTYSTESACNTACSDPCSPNPCGTNATCAQTGTDDLTAQCNCNSGYEYKSGNTCLTSNVGSSNNCVAVPAAITGKTGASDSVACAASDSTIFYSSGSLGSGAAYTTASACGTAFSGYASDGTDYWNYSSGSPGESTSCPAAKTCGTSLSSVLVSKTTPFDVGGGYADGTLIQATFSASGAHHNGTNYVGTCIPVAGPKTQISSSSVNVDGTGTIRCVVNAYFESGIPAGDSVDSYIQVTLRSSLVGCTTLNKTGTFSYEIHGEI